jgi:hypothetical protein
VGKVEARSGKSDLRVTLGRPVQVWLLLGLLSVGLILSAVPSLDTGLQQAAVALGLMAAAGAVLHAPFAVHVARSVADCALAACSWVTGWMLWPLWANGMHRRENSYALFARYPAEEVAPGQWMHYEWGVTSLFGFWIAIGVSAVAVLTIVGCAIRTRRLMKSDLLVAAGCVTFWCVFGPTVLHALAWILD